MFPKLLFERVSVTGQTSPGIQKHPWENICSYLQEYDKISVK